MELALMSRRAFTLFDLILLVAGGGISAGILVPYTVKLRQEALRAQNVNNLKQLALGVHFHHDAQGTMPAGVDANGFSASAQLLPYLEQANVYNLINFTLDVDAKENAQARAVVIKTFLNPNDPIRSVSGNWGATNYLFCAGSKPDLEKNNGVMYRDSKHTLTDIANGDGTSNTLLAGETLKGDSGVKAKDVHRQHVQYKKEALGQLVPNSGVRDFQDDKNIAADRCASWMDGRFLQGTFSATRPLNDPAPDVNCAGVGGLSGLRSLSDTVQVAFCDGSVRAINKKVNLEVWQALATRAGGEIIPNF
jgi:hypothetical protein